MYRNKLGFIIKDDFYPITGKHSNGNNKFSWMVE